MSALCYGSICLPGACSQIYGRYISTTTTTILLLSLVTGLFFLVLLLNHWCSPPLRLQVSDCSTFHIMCDVPRIIVICSESIQCFPGTPSKFCLKPFVTIPVASIITGTILNFGFHIRCISTHKLLYFSFFSTSFCTTYLSAGIATYISMHVFYFFFIVISGLFAVTSLSVFTAWFHSTAVSSCSYTGWDMYLYQLSVVSMPKAVHIE